MKKRKETHQRLKENAQNLKIADKQELKGVSFNLFLGSLGDDVIHAVFNEREDRREFFPSGKCLYPLPGTHHPSSCPSIYPLTASVRPFPRITTMLDDPEPGREMKHMISTSLVAHCLGQGECH